MKQVLFKRQNGQNQLKNKYLFLFVFFFNFCFGLKLSAEATGEQYSISIRDHKPKIEESECLNCHLKKTNFFINSKKQPQRNHEEKILRHGKGEVACGVCHDRNASNLLRSSSENPAHFKFSSPVCMQCHVDIFRNWRDGIHGKRLGGWNLSKEQFQCVDCHDPHSVSYKKMKADPPPRIPKLHVEKIEESHSLVKELDVNKSKLKPSQLTVIEDHVAKIDTYPCSKCHKDFLDKNINGLKLPFTREHVSFIYKHVSDKKSCLLCHSKTNTNQLVMLDGKQIDMQDPSGLCGQCHGPIYSDWQQGIHGKLSAKGTAGQEKVNCTTCHNPHDPKFKQFVADPAPKKPKLMIEKHNDSVIYEGVSHGE